MFSPSQAVCITGLQRSFPEFAMNVRVSLETLLGARDANGVLQVPLENVADFFGVRPERMLQPKLELHVVRL